MLLTRFDDSDKLIESATWYMTFSHTTRNSNTVVCVWNKTKEGQRKAVENELYPDSGLLWYMHQ